MAFQFAYTLSGNAAGTVVKDYPLDTVGNYGVGGCKRGDLVINSAGKLRRAAIASTLASVLGVAEGGEFTGLVAQGQPYAATNSSFTADAINTTRNPNGVGKVRLDKNCVYKVPVWTGGAVDLATAAHINSSFAIAVDGVTGDQMIDLNNTAGSTLLVKLQDYTPDGKFAFVTLL